eukprot:scaffold5479_cov199-Amphora_coffeaeformis.AAC.59
MTAFHAQDIHVVLEEPSRTNPPSTADIQYRMHAIVQYHVAPQIRTNAIQIYFGKSTQMCLVSRTTVNGAFLIDAVRFRGMIDTHRWGFHLADDVNEEDDDGGGGGTSKDLAFSVVALIAGDD